ncbi:MAG: GldG family protein [Gammaproteobacteria bacterium]|nr:GldG family protein [Gammaproteobacteria bacterium]MCF6229369.1 GldG family protein [Gammaproteobacteria bacterium]
MANLHPTKNQSRLQNLVFIVLFLSIIALLAWLSTRYTLESDWTNNSRNTLSEASIQLLATLNKPVEIEAFVREGDLEREAVSDLISRYQRHKADITLHFINPDTEPKKVREQGITVVGELVIHYDKKRENIKLSSEESITNALQRLARADERWIVFLSGHGERDPLGEANFHIGEWGSQLQKKGFQLQKINLSTHPEIPDNTAVLVIADPQTPLLPGEITMIQRYIEQGGNLLWLLEPEQQTNLQPLAEQLSIEILPGTVVDPTGQLLGINDPRFAIVSEYSQHPITAQMEALTLFPQAGGLLVKNESLWKTNTLLTTLARSWLEQDEIIEVVDFNSEKDHPGPIILGLTMTRQSAEREQRMVVIHDADFISNSYLGNGGNLDLGVNIINWLSHDDRFVAIPTKSRNDNQLELSTLDQAIIGFSFLLIIPAGLLVAGVWIWLRRRKR